MPEVEEIRRLLDRGRRVEAIRACEPLIRARGPAWRAAVLIRMEALFRASRYPALHATIRAFRDEFEPGAAPEEAWEFLFRQGRLYHQQGRFKTARLKLLSALEKLRPGANHSACRARTLIALGELAAESRFPADLRIAHGYLRRARATARKIEGNEGAGLTANVLGALGRLHLIEQFPGHDIEKAREYFEQDRALARACGDHEGMEIMGNQIALCCNLLGKPREALGYLDEVSAMEALSDKGRAYGLVEYAWSYLLLEQYDRARRCMDEAWDVAGRIGQNDDFLYDRMAAGLHRLGESKRARTALGRAIKVVERARAQVGSPERRRVYRQAKDTCYRRMALLCAEAGDVHGAASYYEMGGTRTMNDLPPDNERPPPRVERLGEYEEYCRARDRLAAEGGAAARRAFLQACDRLYLHLEYEFTRGTKPLRLNAAELARCRRIVLHHRPARCLAVLLCLEDTYGACVFTARKSRLVRFDMQGPETLRGLDMRTREEIGARVVGPVLEAAGSCGELFFVADNRWGEVALHAALIRGRPVLLDMPVGYTLSTVVSARGLSTKQGSAGGVSLFASEGQASAPAFAGEVRDIAATLRSPRVVTGAAMTRHAVVGALHTRRIVHCACHNKHFAGHRVASVLYCGSGELLTPLDILCAAGVNARLVTLSACESGVMHGDVPREPVGHLSALFRRGAREVLCSGGLVHGPSAGEFMKLFYAGYRGNALRAYQAAAREMHSRNQDAAWTRFFLYSL